jgi:hypothetical protein
MPPHRGAAGLHTVRIVKRVFIATAVMLWLIGPAITSVFAGGYDHGKATGGCYFDPATAVVGQPYEVRASGLPTSVNVELFILNYQSRTRQYGPLAVNADGTWSGTFTQTTDGKFKFEFVSASTNATRLASKDAVCTITISALA